MTLAAIVAARLAGKVSTRKVILTGQISALTAGVAMLVGAVALGTPRLLAILCFFVLMTAQGLMIPNAGALASAEVPDHPGTGSALLGCVQWLAAGIIPPIAGLGGTRTAVPMAILMVDGAAVSMAGLLVLARPTRLDPSGDPRSDGVRTFRGRPISNPPTKAGAFAQGEDDPDDS
jgi:DHA1 family bicyclomycin/chloramphenicol resistance-like MFS transporter